MLMNRPRAKRKVKLARLCSAIFSSLPPMANYDSVFYEMMHIFILFLLLLFIGSKRRTKTENFAQWKSCCPQAQSPV